MCGICGVKDKIVIDRNNLKEMTSSLRHRGPDSSNIEVLRNTGLGHARLSIIDLSASGNQPMSNEDQTIWLTYNGEFYTFIEYKEELIKKGHIFKSNTDSEVIIHLYEEYGLEFVEKLRGMFSFAIYNSKEDRLVLVRDRVGIKPLYYYYDGSKFVFASEIKAILKYPGVNREIDFEALNMFFTFGYISGEKSIYKNIKKLPPAHYLVFEKDKIKIKRYWTLPGKINYRNEHETLIDLDNILNEAVRMRMVSDVPLGVLLSGGVDSSLVASIMAKHSDKPIKTFSISFSDNKYNEIEHARKVAEYIGSEHYEFNVDLEKSEIIEDLMYYYDEPFADSSAIPTYFVSKMAKEYVTVVLSGDGGDELFGGYNWYDWMYRKAAFERVPITLRRIIGSLNRITPLNYPGKHFLSVFDYNEYDTFFERTAFFNKKELKKLLNIDRNEDYLNDYKDFYNNSGTTLLQRLTRTDFNHYLSDDILTKVDRASMSVSLEARVPLLDHKLCEFAFSLPDEFKIKGRYRKYIIKQIAKNYLPPDFNYERKQGFSIPQSEWLRGKYGDIILDMIPDNEYLHKNYVKALVKEHKSGNKINSKKLWPILIFLLWNNNK